MLVSTILIMHTCAALQVKIMNLKSTESVPHLL